MSKYLERSLSEITLEDFSDYLANKNISRKCMRCGELSLQVSVQENDDANNYVRVIKHSLMNSDKVVFPTVFRICANCGSLEHYGAVSIIEFLEADDVIKHNKRK
ncbi:MULTISPECIES: hypothetical protein [unclassified Agarivorans]|uniref:hypothetical protein n=1 Tax=unclassified Agarivorans TaxID=2636026 RepID=UPI0026E2B957|nr:MULTISPECIES: hypothetical protein [unclassified Agarivorans]MDO6685366.1 hypothetical protein [Agarivorans sp. 3_MG-2023]MDO6715462.1 hypothetical protein [Agarivorans sp. 2_MG-2023]